MLLTIEITSFVSALAATVANVNEHYYLTVYWNKFSSLQLFLWILCLSRSVHLLSIDGIKCREKKSQTVIIFTISIRVAYALSRYSNLSLMIMKPVNSHHQMTSRTYVSRYRWHSLAKIIWNHKFLTSIFGRLKLNSFTSLWWNSAPPRS